LGIYRPPRTAPGIPAVHGAGCTGVAYRVAAAQGISTPVLAAGAARAALAAAGLSPQAIGMVAVATTSPDVLWPSTACLVQNELGIPPVGSFDLAAAEAGLVTAVGVADRFVRSGLPAALVIAAESDNQLVDLPGQSTPRRRVAAAVVLRRTESDDSGILSTVSGGAAGDPDALPAHIDAAVEQCLAAAGVRLAEIDLIVGEATQPETMHDWAHRQRVPTQRLLMEAGQDAPALTVAPLLALYDAVTDHRLRPGMVCLLISCGRGPAWSVACIRWGGGGIRAW